MTGVKGRFRAIGAPVGLLLCLACSVANQSGVDKGGKDAAPSDGPDATNSDASGVNSDRAPDAATSDALQIEAGTGSPGTLTVDTTCGLIRTVDCPDDHLTDGHCGLEEAVIALNDQKSEFGCNWSGPIGLDARIIVPASETFSVSAPLQISHAVTIMSSDPGTLATIQTAAETDLFGVAPNMPVSITFKDLHLIGFGEWLDVQFTGISISGESPVGGATVNVTQCWIEQFSNGAIVASDVTLNVTDSTLDSNANDFGDGGGGIFYGTNGDAKSQTDFLTIKNSSITHNHSTKGGGIQIQSNSISRIINSTISDNLTDGGHGGGISFANNAGPLADGVLQILESTVAYNGSTQFDGGGIAVGANRELFVDNIDNKLYLVGSIVANNCLGQMNPNGSFTCLSPNDVFGDVYQLQDSLLGSSMFSTIVGADKGGEGLGGAALLDVDPGLDPELTDQGGLGEHHPPVHMLKSTSVAIDATEAIGKVAGTDEASDVDQTHQRRGFDYPPAGPKTYDLGAVERRSVP